MAEQTSSEKKTDEQNLIVALRIRPINEDEIIEGATPVAHKVGKDMVVLMDPTDDPDDILRANRSREKQYVFDLSFDGSASQEEVYSNTAKLLIPSVINGYNATVFAYGATGAGKTHTMLGPDDDPGIMGRSLNELFLEMERTKEEMLYKVSMSYLEIYNEMIRDLLNPATGFLELREDSKGVQVSGLSEVQAKSTEEVMEMLLKGNKERTQEPTAANKASSRSHAILQVIVKQRSRVRNTQQQIRVGKLYLIDLAGSERAANTLNRGKRMVEGAHINRSLLALGNCINALSDKTGTRYVNFRDSKLTRLLKDSLGGNCKTVMIAHISPASIHFEESRNTLAYADRAKHIKTKIRKNTMDVNYHIAQYTNIITELRDEIHRLRKKLDNQNKSTLHAIQTEVLDPANEGDLNKLKDQLLNIFKDQMTLRRSLMELNNTAMQIHLEKTRNELLVRNWEREKAMARGKEGDGDLETFPKDGDLEKETESSLNYTVEPEDVRAAREEIKSLEKERESTNKLKVSVMKELENAREKAGKVEELLPTKISSKAQQEVLSLVCKVHELEIENLEMQSSCLLRNFELRQKDMILQKHEQHRTLCEEIIHQQRALLDENNVHCPKELEDLYELYGIYRQQMEDEQTSNEYNLPPLQSYKTHSVSNISRAREVDSFSDMERLSAVDEEFFMTGGRNLHPHHGASRRHPSKRSANSLARLDDSTDKVFSHSPKAREIREAQAKAALGHNSQSAESFTPIVNERTRQKSIITLSSRSNNSSPSPPGVNSNRLAGGDVALKKSVEDRDVIQNNTRGIAALAAKRRTKASINVNTNDRLGPPAFDRDALSRTYVSIHSDNYLTHSRLEHHDKNYGSTLTMKGIPDDTMSSGFNDPLESSMGTTARGRQSRPLYRPQPGTRKNQANHSNASLRKKKAGEYNYQQLAKATPGRKLVGEKENSGNQSRTEPKSYLRRSRLPAPTNSHHQAKPKGRVQDSNGDVSHFESNDMYPSTVHQSGADKGKGLKVQRKVRGPSNVLSDSSGKSTPQLVTTKKGRKPPPTIPSYGKADIGVMGFSIHGK